MPIRNANFYTAQSTRRYPLDDNATGLTDSGAQIEDDILVDCRLAWPASLGRYAFLTALTVSPRLVTAIFAAAPSLDATSGFQIIASVTLPKPLDRWRTYLVDAQWPGVRGAVVFGDTAELFTGRFKTPRQGLISPNCTFPFADYPIPTLRKRNVAAGLQGIVRLTASGDLEIVPQAMEIDGCVRQAIVFRLKQNIGNRNLLQAYIGNCNNRPESRNCLGGEGIETLAGVSPDCAGNIGFRVNGVPALVFANCGEPDSGIGVTTDLAIADLCDPRNPNRFEGEDYCGSSASIPSEGSEGSESQSSESSDSQPSDSVVSESCVSLPFAEDFDDGVANLFEVKIGTFTFISADSPAEEPDGETSEISISGGDVGEVAYFAADQSRRNVSVFSPACGITSSWGKRVVASVRVSNVGPRANGGVAVNYHLVDPITNPHFEYFFCCINRTENEVQIYRFNGGSLIKLAGITPGSPLVFDDWYKIQVDVVQFDLTQTAIAVTVSGETNLGWGPVSLSILTNRFGVDDGQYGVGTDRSQAAFSYFSLSDI